MNEDRRCGTCNYFRRLSGPQSFGICRYWDSHNLEATGFPWWSTVRVTYGSMSGGAGGDCQAWLPPAPEPKLKQQDDHERDC